MEIREITTAYKMSITISNQNSNMILNSDIVFIRDGKLYVKPFEYNGVVLNFDSANVNVSMIAYQEEKAPYLWKVVRIGREVLDGIAYHVITSELNGVRINRRENFRVFLGIDGTATVLSNGAKISAMVKDISENGFAILVDTSSEVKINKNELVLAEFYDRGLDQQFALTGRVMRAEVLERAILYGCRLTKPEPAVQRYIANKQLEKRVNKNKKDMKK